jgi:hypothetical protein
MSRDQQIEALADAISRVEDPAQRTAIAMDIFGKSGNKLMPMRWRERCGRPMRWSL